MAEVFLLMFNVSSGVDTMRLPDYIDDTYYDERVNRPSDDTYIALCYLVQDERYIAELWQQHDQTAWCCHAIFLYEMKEVTP